MYKKNPLISVIVPIYNVESYLQKCIDSIRQQSYLQLEIILVNDGSSDGCASICDINAKLDYRIIVIHKENGGLSSARNAGLNIAKGEFVSFIDADDSIHSQFIEILVGLCLQYESEISQCDFLSVSEASRKLPINPQQSICIYNSRQALYKLCCTSDDIQYAIACNKLYKRSLFDNIRYPINRLHEDEFTTYLLFWKANKIVVINQYLYYYLQRPTSISNRKFTVERLDAIYARLERLEFLKQNKLECEYVSTLQVLSSMIPEYYMLLKENVSDCEEISVHLLSEKEKIDNLLKESILQKDFLKKICTYPKYSKIILYGAGHWGRIFYDWIKKNHHGAVVGWVDNNWSEITNLNYSIMPIDAIFEIKFDYILITIKSRLVQEEVFKNLTCWGIDENKILFNV